MAQAAFPARLQVTEAAASSEAVQVPADVRLLATAGLECEESVLTGESVPAEKSAGAVPAGTPLAELSCCALMGTVVRAGWPSSRPGNAGSTAPAAPATRHRNPAYRLLRRAARFTTADSLPDREEPRHSPEPAHGNPKAT